MTIQYLDMAHIYMFLYIINAKMFVFFITAIGVCFTFIFCYMYIYVIQIIKQMKYLTLQFSLVCPTFSIMILQY